MNLGDNKVLHHQEITCLYGLAKAANKQIARHARSYCQRGRLG